MMKTVFICWAFLFVSAGLKAQHGGFYSFKQNEKISYCKTRGSTPDNIVRMDNNWALLLTMRTPQSKKELDALGIPYTDSQLRLLEEWNLIKREEDLYQTTMIILDSLHTSKLREYSRELSGPLTSMIKQDVSELVNLLSGIGREENAYSILFSYVIDGLVWRCLEEKGLIKRSELNLENPFWNGEFWTLYPKRGFYCGTNSLSDKGYSIKINWSEKAISRMHPFIARVRLLEQFLDNITAKGRVTDPEVLAEFSDFNLFDSDGRITIPVIVENNDNPIYALSRKIATSITRFLETGLDMVWLKKEFYFHSDAQTIIILYHEMLWDILSRLEKEEVITKPIIFSDTEKAKQESVSDLVFLVQEKDC